MKNVTAFFVCTLMATLIVFSVYSHSPEVAPVPDMQGQTSGYERSILMQRNADGTVSYIAFTKTGDLEICVRDVLYQSLLDNHDLYLRRVWQGEAE